ncbi:MAG: hypothetical protein LBF66_00680 [Holosporales bacterium]|nr:hypothetical protein [Holosporales bacterium]
MSIHIPSDDPGFLIDQSLVTSGLVPRSVSLEPTIDVVGESPFPVSYRNYLMRE